MAEPSYHESIPGKMEILRWPHRHPLPESEIIAFFTSRGLNPIRWSNGPGETYPVHDHSYRKTLFCVAGSVAFSLTDLEREAALRPGDRLTLAPGVRHSAVVGPEGCVCIEAGE